MVSITAFCLGLSWVSWFCSASTASCNLCPGRLSLDCGASSSGLITISSINIGSLGSGLSNNLLILSRTGLGLCSVPSLLPAIDELYLSSCCISPIILFLSSSDRSWLLRTSPSSSYISPRFIIVIGNTPRSNNLKLGDVRKPLSIGSAICSLKSSLN